MFAKRVIEATNMAHAEEGRRPSAEIDSFEMHIPDVRQTGHGLDFGLDGTHILLIDGLVSIDAYMEGTENAFFLAVGDVEIDQIICLFALFSVEGLNEFPIWSLTVIHIVLQWIEVMS